MNSNNSYDNSKSTHLNQNEYINLNDVFGAILNFKWVIVALVILAGGLSFLISHFTYTPKYTASATFTVSTQNSSIAQGGIDQYTFYYDTETASRLSLAFPYILSSNILQDDICEDLGLTSIPATMEASAIDGSNLFTINVSGNDPKLIYDILLSAIKNFPSAAKHIIGSVNLEIMSEPKIPEKASNENDYIRVTAIGSGAGLLLGLALAMLYLFLRKTVKNRDDIEENFKLETLGILPSVAFKKYKLDIDRSLLITNQKAGNRFAEAVRLFRNTVLNKLNKDDKIIMVTSTVPGEGKTTATVNFALSLAASEKRVLIVDADLRNPSVNHALNITNEDITVTEKEKQYNVSEIKKYNLSVLNFDVKDTKYWDVMEPDFIHGLLEKFKESFDCILIDTPPCGLISDSIIIAQEADAAIYVILQDAVSVQKIGSGIATLLSSDIKILGCVLNGFSSGLSGAAHNNYSKYKSYGRYRYGYGHNADNKQVY